MYSIDELKKEIENFVSEKFFIIISEDKNFTSCFKRFPLGCCGNSCNILEDHFPLIKKLGFNYKDGYLKKYTEQSHAWLENDEYIIDLTAHQFNERFGQKFDEIIVCKKEDYPLEKYLDRNS